MATSCDVYASFFDERTRCTGGEMGTFTEEERNLLSDTSLYKFFSSDLGKRLINAKRIERELPFSMLFEGKRVYDTLEDGENLFLQGIIDTAFEEDGEWVLVDYKTDRVHPEKNSLNDIKSKWTSIKRPCSD